VLLCFRKQKVDIVLDVKKRLFGIIMRLGVDLNIGSVGNAERKKRKKLFKIDLTVNIKGIHKIELYTVQ